MTTTHRREHVVGKYTTFEQFLQTSFPLARLLAALEAVYEYSACACLKQILDRT